MEISLCDISGITTKAPCEAPVMHGRHVCKGIAGFVMHTFVLSLLFVWGLNRIIPFCGKSVQGMREETQKTGSKRRKPGVTAIHPCQFHPAVTRNVTRGSSCTGTHFLLKWIRKAIRPDTRKAALGSDPSVPAAIQPKSPRKLDSFIHALIFIYFPKGGNDYG